MRFRTCPEVLLRQGGAVRAHTERQMMREEGAGQRQEGRHGVVDVERDRQAPPDDQKTV